jgi:hypothetical protein
VTHIVAELTAAPDLASNRVGGAPEAACSIEGCGRTVRRRGLCRTHYARFLRDGVVLDLPIVKQDHRPLLEKFEIEADGCWRWNGQIDREGYGIANHRLAHRVVYERLVEPIAAGMVLDHLCRVTCCVNPDHLEPVTQAENMRRSRLSACRRGHDFTPENTYIQPTSGVRVCRTCKRDRQRNRRASA